jgi:hypothetical protein
MTTTQAGTSTGFVLAQATPLPGTRTIQARERTLADIAQDAKLQPSEAVMARVYIGAVEYVVALARPATVAGAQANLASQKRHTTGYLTLASGKGEYALANGKMAFSITCEDPSPEGQQARADKLKEKAVELRRRDARALMTRTGCSFDEATRELDHVRAYTGLEGIKPTGPRPVLAQPAHELSDLAHPVAPENAASMHEGKRRNMVAKVRSLVTSGSWSVVKGSEQIAAWDAAYPAPLR